MFLLSLEYFITHTLVGLAIAVANIDDVIAAIRKSKDPAEARAALIERSWPVHEVLDLVNLIADPRQRVDEKNSTVKLTEEQTKAILELRLQRLTAMERGKIASELEEIMSQIHDFIQILQDPETLKELLGKELLRVKDDYADPRRTELTDQEFEADIEDLIQREEMVVSLSHSGYVKRVPLSKYRSQKRGGKGRSGMRLKDDDFVSRVFVVNTHTPVLFFSTAGKVYKLKVYRLPVAEPQARGKALVNLLPLSEGETISTILPMPEDEEAWSGLELMFATTGGYVRRISAADFTNVPSNGKIAMKLADGDGIVGVSICSINNDVLLAASGGKCVRFSVPDVRLFKGRSSQGVRGMLLSNNDHIVSMTILTHVELNSVDRDGYFGRKREGEIPTLTEGRHSQLSTTEQFLLTVRSDGYGKRTSAHDYRLTKRGGKGVINIDLGNDSHVVATMPIEDDAGVMLVTDAGQMIRCSVSDISKVGRTARGVRIFRLSEGEHVMAVAQLDDQEESENQNIESEQSETSVNELQDENDKT